MELKQIVEARENGKIEESHKWNMQHWGIDDVYCRISTSPTTADDKMDIKIKLDAGGGFAGEMQMTLSSPTSIYREWYVVCSVLTDILWGEIVNAREKDGFTTEDLRRAQK